MVFTAAFEAGVASLPSCAFVGVGVPPALGRPSSLSTLSVSVTSPLVLRVTSASAACMAEAIFAAAVSNWLSVAQP